MKELKALENNFKSFFQNTKGKRIGLAFSGGLDSRFLLEALKRFAPKDLNICILHINHHLRSDEEIFSEQELVFAAALETGFPLYMYDCAKNEISLEMQKSGQGLEAAARKVRYRQFEVWRAALELDRIFIAHHQDDNLEAILFNILKDHYDSLEIPGSRDAYVRPLLHCKRSFIYDQARKWQLRWHEDSSNQKNDFDRNKLRNQVLPLLGDLFPGLRTALFNFSAKQALDQQYFDSYLDRLEYTLHESGDWGRLHRNFTPGLLLEWKNLEDDYFKPAFLRRLLKRGIKILHEREALFNFPSQNSILAFLKSFSPREEEAFYFVDSLKLFRQERNLYMQACIVLAEEFQYLVFVEAPGTYKIPGFGQIQVENLQEKEVLFPCEFRPLAYFLEYFLTKKALGSLKKILGSFCLTLSASNTMLAAYTASGDLYVSLLPWKEQTIVLKKGTVSFEEVDKNFFIKETELAS